MDACQQASQWSASTFCGKKSAGCDDSEKLVNPGGTFDPVGCDLLLAGDRTILVAACRQVEVAHGRNRAHPTQSRQRIFEVAIDGCHPHPLACGRPVKVSGEPIESLDAS